MEKMFALTLLKGINIKKIYRNFSKKVQNKWNVMVLEKGFEGTFIVLSFRAKLTGVPNSSSIIEAMSLMSFIGPEICFKTSIFATTCTM